MTRLTNPKVIGVISLIVIVAVAYMYFMSQYNISKTHININKTDKSGETHISTVETDNKGKVSETSSKALNVSKTGSNESKARPAPTPLFLNSPNFRLVSYNGSHLTIANYGENVTLKLPVRRIVADHNVAFEILVSIGAANYVVGVEGYTAQLRFLYRNLPELPLVSKGMYEVNYELIVQLSPDVVITRSHRVSAMRQKLRPFSIPVVGYGPSDNLTSLIYYLGLITNRTDAAFRLINFYSDTKRILETRLSNVENVLKAYVVSHYPLQSLYLVAGNETSPYWAVLAAGLKPCFNKTMQVQPEAVLSCNPDVVIVPHRYLNPYAHNATESCLSVIKAVKTNPVFNRTNAVKNGNVIVIPDYLTHGVGRYIASLYIASRAYPQAFRDVDPDYYLNYYLTNFLTTARPGGTWWCVG